MESNATGTVARDPVCGMDVEIASAQNTTEYQGQTYYFCSRGCMLDFQDDPEKYLDPSYVPMGMDGH
jgi:YHS domain-containing protein